MKRTAEELQQILNYEKISAIRILESPRIEKEDIPKLISCPNFGKAKRKIEQKMERYNSKAQQLEEKLDQTKQNIAAMEKKQEKWSRKASTFLLDRSNPRAVEKQNQAADNANRLLDQISSATEKHNDLIDRHNEAVEEAREKLEELTQDALVAIDEDIVAVLDKCTRILDKLSGSQNTENVVAAIEICLIAMKIFAFFEDQIDGNAARKDCRDRITEVNKLFEALCANEHVRNYISDLFRKNIFLAQKNGDLYTQVVNALGSVDQGEFDRLKQSVLSVLKEEQKKEFVFEGIIDPAELDAIMVNIKNSIADLNRCIADSMNGTAEAAVSAHHNAQTILASMKSNVETMSNDILSVGHFAIDMIDESVIEDFYSREIRPAAMALRKNIEETVGEEQVDSLVVENEDQFSLIRTNKAIEKANLLLLQIVQHNAKKHIEMLTGLIANADEVPQKHADTLRAKLSTKYACSFIPFLGFLYAIGILKKIKSYEPAFRSNNKIYRNLGTEILAKNSKMTTIIIILSFLLGIGGMVAIFNLNLGPDVTMEAQLILGVTFGLYLITSVMLAAAGKRLRSYTKTPVTPPAQNAVSEERGGDK